MTYDRNERIRRAAILVASLDEAMAEALLGDLPPLDAAKVLAELERMDSLDPEEQADVLEEFRRATRRSGAEAGGVEFAYSTAPEAPVVQDLSAGRPAAEAASPGVGSDADAAAMAELLAREQPQIIAAALSRLGAERGAAVFAALPAELQAEALERLSRLAPADEEAVLEVESLLLRQLDERREHRERAAAGVALAHKILAKTAPDRRAVLLARLPGGRSAPPSAAPRRPTAPPMAQQAIHLASTIDRQRDEAPFNSTYDDGPWQAADGEAPQEDVSDELMMLSDAELVAALRAAGEQTVQRALAASGERLVDRVARMLPRRQARKLRKLLQSFGPARLVELRQAQHELLRIAHEQHEFAA